MRLGTKLGAVTAAAALALGGSVFAAPSANAASPKPLSEVLLADGDTFDRSRADQRNWYDFDIVTQAALTVIGAKPDSPVALLTKGEVALTAFLPNDRAFQVLVADLTGQWLRSEKKVFNAVASLGVDTVEAVLLYHVIPGATIDSKTALKSDGAVLNTALEGTSFEVDVISKFFKIVQLVDNDPDDINPFLVRSKLDINKGNPQIAHGISFVLRPQDL